MKDLILLLIALEAACSAGCNVDVGTSDCERLFASVEAAAERCGFDVLRKRSCDGVIVSSGVDIEACVAWHETASCAEMYADRYWPEACNLNLLVSPL